MDNTASNSLGELQETHGRGFNTAEVSYNLPADQIERTRLNKQHLSFVTAMGGLYPCPSVVEAMLEPVETGSSLRILDVGCGSGVWAIEIARRFPRAEVIGIDVSPVPIPPLGLPSNVAFNQANINDGLLDYRDQFDLIHLRCVVSGVTDMRKSLQDIENCLKPGGLMILVVPDWVSDHTRERYMRMAKIDGDNEVDGTSEEGSWFMRLFYESEDRARIDGSSHAVDLTTFDRVCWEDDLCDPENTVSGSLWIQISDWVQDLPGEDIDQIRRAGKLLQENLLEISNAFGPLIARRGIEREVVDGWVRNAQHELSTMHPRMWNRIRFFLTQRRPDLRLEASLVSKLSQMAVPQNSATLETYRTREEAIAALEKRTATLGTFPQSAVSRALER